jgi:predicted nucleotidyltransferase
MTNERITVETLADVYRQLIRIFLENGSLQLSALTSLRSNPFALDTYEGSSVICLLREACKIFEQAAQKLSVDDKVRLPRAIVMVLVDLERDFRATALTQDRARERAQYLPTLTIKEEHLQHLPTTHREELQRFLQGICKSHLAEKPVDFYLFGSMARGRSDALSDVDIAVVSDYFSGIPFAVRIERLHHLHGSQSRIVRPIGLTRQEYEKAKYPAIAVTVRRRGVPVASTQPVEA